MRAPLLAKLLSAYLVPTLALATLAPLVGWAVARRSLQDEVALRLTGAASAAAASVRGELIVTLQPGDEGNRTHRNVLQKLESLRSAARLERLYLFDPGHRLLATTGANAPPIGAPLPELERDRLEIERARGGEPTASSVAFRGLDGRMYRSAFAPITDAEGQVVALAGADASAEFFEVLRRFGGRMAAVALGCALLGFLLFWLAAHRWLLEPIRGLLAAARRIGRGDLSSPLASRSRDELGALANEMEQMRQKLFDRERELQMMLAGIAHEVRNPLGGIELFAGLLAEELHGDSERLCHVRKIQRELGHLKRVVEDFLGYAREPKLALEPLDAGALLRELADLVQADAEAKHQTVVVDTDPPFTFQADASTLRRALLNLIRNAQQAAPEGSQIRLRARQERGRVLLAVSDQGPGVPPAERERLFTPFHTTKEQGLGLGLALVRRVAQAHGGTARYEASEGAGATFVIDIPA